MKIIPVKIIFLSIILCIGFWGCTDTVVTPGDRPITYDSTAWGDPLKMVWRAPRIGNTEGGSNRIIPALFEDKIIFVHSNVVECFKKETGESLWSVESNSSVYANQSYLSNDIIIENGKFFFAGTTYLECRNLSDGALVWRYELPNRDVIRMYFSQYAQSDNALFITTHYSDEVVAISKSSGSVLWSTPGAAGIEGKHVPDGSYPGAAMYHKGKVYVSSTLYPGTGPIVDYAGGGISAYDAQTGKQLWKKMLPEPDPSILGYADWRALGSNTSNTTVLPVEDGLIFTAGAAIVKTDFEGNIKWRRVVNFGDRISSYMGNSVLYKGNFYSYNNGDAKSFSSSVNPYTGDINWQAYISKAGETHTVIVFPAQIDNDIFYKVTDDEWLIGQDINSGAVVSASHLAYVEMDGRNRAGFMGAYRVEGKRIYFLTAKSIVCMERK